MFSRGMDIFLLCICLAFIKPSIAGIPHETMESIASLAAAYVKLVCAKRSETCSVDVSNSKSVFLVNEKDHLYSLFQKADNIDANEFIGIFCPGKDNFIAGLPGDNYRKAKCMCGDVFLSGMESLPVNQLTCDKPLRAEVIEGLFMNVVTADGTKKMPFNVIDFRNTRHISMIEIPFYYNIFEDDLSTGLYSMHSTVRGTTLPELAQIEAYDLPAYDDFSCYPEGQGKNIFDRKNQEKTFDTHLGSDRQDYVTERGPDYLVNAPLMPAYFIGKHVLAEALAASCGNMVPQFDTIRKGNWLTTQKQISKWYLKKYPDYSYDIYMSREPLKQSVPGLPDMGFYMHAWTDGHGKVQRRMKIPNYLVMLVIDPKDKKGYAFVTINNPYISKRDIETKVGGFCSSRHDTYMGWDNNDRRKGYSFYCRVNDFYTHSKHPYLPDKKIHEIKEGLWYVHDENK